MDRGEMATGAPAAASSVAAIGSRSERYRITRRVTFVGATVNVLLSLAQVSFGILGQSQALIADGIHTLSDLVSDGIVLLAARFSHRRADDEHPYGHGRYETLAVVALGILLLMVAVAVAWDATERLLAPQRLLEPGSLALVAAGLGIVAKEALYHYTRISARRIRSRVLEANAWHHRSDALSSVVVFAGIVGTLAGFSSLDALATIGVALLIAYIAVRLIWRASRELVDTGLDPETVGKIRACILSSEGVEDLHVLRTRRLGPDVFVDVHIIVDSRLTVSEGHYISERVRARVVKALDDVSDVLVHIDPEDDEVVDPSKGLPTRAALTRALLARWAEQPEIERLNLHYLNGKVDVDIVLPVEILPEAGEPSALLASFRQAARGVAALGRVDLYFH